MKKYGLIVWCFLFLKSILFAQMPANPSFSEIEIPLSTQSNIYPQEKIHLHTDRDYYVPGERIWFKAYITDAATHQPVIRSRYIYVELIDVRDSLVGRVMIHPENKLFHGHLFLSEVIPEGNYTLRAYTRYMENLGDDYFFKKNIRIGLYPALSEREGSPTPSLPNREGERDTAERNAAQRINSLLLGETEGAFDVTFFPEGGNLVEGVFCKVAFKALNQNGYAETITGEIVDVHGTVITSVQTFHAGMGVFNYFPIAETRYFLQCRNVNGIEKQFELPRADARAYALTVTQSNKRVSVGVRHSAHNPDIPLYLLALSRGRAVFFLLWDNTKESVSFEETELPAGIIQLILFDDRMNLLSERLLFNKNSYIHAKVGFKTDREVYQKREKVVVTLSFPDSLAPSLSGSVGEGLLSIAITDDKDIAVDAATTILSSLLLSSDLKGYIENPAYYLQDNTESAVALDYLMLTHGWRRYNIPETLKGNYELPQIPFQESMVISGRVESGFFRSRPATGSEISIIAEGDFGLTTSDEKGAFTFRDFEYPENTVYFIQALNRKGGNNVETVIDQELFPKLVYAPQSPVVEIPLLAEETKSDIEPNAFIAKAAQRSQYDEDMRVIQLSEVEVTAPRIERKEEPRLQYWGNRDSEVTIRREDVEKSSPLLVKDWLRGIVGVDVSSGGLISIRNSPYLPLILVDGIPMYWPHDYSSPYDSPLESVSVHDVESIDIIKGAGAAAFGTRGAGGVISITTKRGVEDFDGENDERNNIVFTPLGYQKPVEFYSPRYETLEAKYQSIPDYRTTIFWKPDIVISEGGEVNFDFYTSDFPTTYSVVIEGITTEGRIVRQVEKIAVNY